MERPNSKPLQIQNEVLSGTGGPRGPGHSVYTCAWGVVDLAQSGRFERLVVQPRMALVGRSQSVSDTTQVRLVWPMREATNRARRLLLLGRGRVTAKASLVGGFWGAALIAKSIVFIPLHKRHLFGAKLMIGHAFLHPLNEAQ